jgi:hypothetical protein
MLNITPWAAFKEGILFSAFFLGVAVALGSVSGLVYLVYLVYLWIGG